MNLSFEPSLEHMSLVKVATTVYSVSKISDLEKESELPLDFLSNKKLEAILRELISKTNLPKPLQKNVMAFIKPINCEVRMWRRRHDNIVDDNLDVRKYLAWKSEGTIDRHKTALQLVQSNILPINKSFVLACLYCLSEFADSLWRRMSKWQRIQCSEENNRNPSLRKYISKLRGRSVELNVKDCHTVSSLRLVLAQLTPEQRKFSLLITVRHHFQDSHVLRYCLSHMEEKEQAKVFEAYPCEVLSSFLEYPLQSLFIDVANRLWNHLPKHDFCSFLRFILNERIATGWTDFCYEELLQQFWYQSPQDFKDFAYQKKNLDTSLLTSILNRSKVSSS